MNIRKRVAAYRLKKKKTGNILETTSEAGVRWERNSYISDSIVAVGGPPHWC